MAPTKRLTPAQASLLARAKSAPSQQIVCTSLGECGRGARFDGFDNLGRPRVLFAGQTVYEVIATAGRTP